VSILGTRVLRTEDPRFLTTGGIYTDDLRLPGACHVHFVRSTVAHARIASVDVSAALAEPGVIAAFTGADLDLDELAPPMAGMINAQMSQPLLARDVVRYVGEPVAGPSARRSPSAAAGTGRWRPTGWRSCRTPGPTRGSARSCPC
jgi:aerobic carbon-monoxide dehydrogenase large subunit